MELSYRSVFVSDTHLGMRGVHAEELAAFLKHVRCERLYLVGDIIDVWSLKARWRWPAAHNQVIRRVLKMARKGVAVTYIPGNHDDALRQYVGLDFGGVRIAMRAIHRTADGRSLLVTHGDEFDLVVQNSRLLAMVGGWAYDHLVAVNRLVNACRGAMGLRRWSFAAAIKSRVKTACTFVSNYEHALLSEAGRRGLHGVVCGHVHKAALEPREQGLVYANCGDWIERPTALVEHHDGRLELLDVESSLAAACIEVNREVAEPVELASEEDAEVLGC